MSEMPSPDISSARPADDRSGSHHVTLIQFARWPELGKVKTRLAPALGEEGALKAHMQLTATVLTSLAGTELPLQFWWDRALEPVPEPARHLVKALNQRAVVQRVQKGEGLGARMNDAFERTLARYRKAIIVGSDCPSVDGDYVRDAVAALDHADVVIGPSDDGGYVLLGARRVAEGMLDDIEWGSPQVLEQTCQRLDSVGLTFSLLEPRWDVDEIEDWQRFLAMPV
ncbi:TIGR04282 family arsenosugar biosynthesis glycosyltransferase [Marinobacter sp.]|uniref:TIGR04282 family arsenosugar biosynthesis glycosyltransferase n=1 Tax=Marinobacter sp. TaxID=50741 RepID=UPI00384D7619